MATNHGTVQLADGSDISLMQQAYPDGDGHKTWYQAIGRDVTGNTYRVRWAVVNAECDDGIDACDWAHPHEIKLVERADDDET